METSYTYFFQGTILMQKLSFFPIKIVIYDNFNGFLWVDFQQYDSSKFVIKGRLKSTTFIKGKHGNK